MHAAIHQLLSLRDGEPVDAEVSRHIEHCAVCSRELARLDHLQQRMQSMPAFEPPADAWEKIEQGVPVMGAQPKSRVPWAIAAAVVVAVVSGLLIRQPDPEMGEQPIADSQEPEATSESPLDRLVAQSQELDEMLQYLPERPAVERVAVTATIDGIEQRVQWLDQQIAYANDAGMNDAQSYDLWRERVDLMDSLVKVRYAEGARMSF